MVAIGYDWSFRIDRGELLWKNGQGYVEAPLYATVRVFFVFTHIQENGFRVRPQVFAGLSRIYFSGKLGFVFHGAAFADGFLL